jgi:hypothetical protein
MRSLSGAIMAAAVPKGAAASHLSRRSEILILTARVNFNP